jgi:hypothetical protein
MKIYFTASVSAKEEHPEVTKDYERIVRKLEALGHEVTADHVINVDHEFIKNVEDDYRTKYYRELLNKINRADLVFSEMTYSSASIGHEVTLALEKNKPVVVASKTGRIPQIFKAIQESNLHFIEYDKLEDLLERLEGELEEVKEGEDIRFNFLIPPSMVDYLEWVSRTKRIPKSVFIRNLIKGEMTKDEM